MNPVKYLLSCGTPSTNRLRAVASVLILMFGVMQAQTPQSHGKPTEKVVIEYERLVSNGALLTPKGWEKAGKLFSQSRAYPRDGEIFLMTTGGSLGEHWIHGDSAEVETKWTDFLGSIDSSLRYKPPERDVPVTMTAFVFRLVHTNKHRDIGKNGETIKETIGPWEWKMEEPQTLRWATVDRAVEYVRMMRDKTDDLSLKHNASKTLAALKKLRPGCGNASAC